MVHDVDAHLDRIGYTGSRAPSAHVLAALQRAHLLSVPFENLDIHAGRPIVLEEPALFEKIVERRRGGLCYELNATFAALLGALGFDVTLLSGRVHARGAFGPEFDHLALLVRLDEPWLVDVGFGESFVEPLSLVATETDADGYRARDASDHWLVERRAAEGAWEPHYAFSLVPRRLADFDTMCRYHQTSPESPFTRKRVVSRLTVDGRVTLTGRTLLVTSRGTKVETALADDSAVAAALREHFDFADTGA
jgi:N-hydroxyarylamine O-acetyltransferase